MPKDLLCWSCGQSASEHPTPMSTYAECSSCNAQLHVCRMCGYWDSQIRTGCKEERAEEIRDREKANFCEWFLPSTEVFDPERANQAHKAEQDLASLFGESSGTTQAEANDSLVQSAEDLFK